MGFTALAIVLRHMGAMIKGIDPHALRLEPALELSMNVSQCRGG